MSDEKKQDEKHEGLLSKTLNAAGWSYVLGDIAMILASVARAEPGKKMGAFKEEAGGATVWLLGGLGAAAFGHPDIDTQVRIQARKLEQFAKQKGVQIDDKTRAESPLLAQRSFVQNFKDFCHEHPSEILNAGYAIGAAMLLHGGAKKIFVDKTHKLLPEKVDLKHSRNLVEGLNHSLENVATSFWMGALVLTGALIGLFAKEQPHGADKDGAGDAKKPKAFGPSPLAVAAGCYMLNNGFLAIRFGQDLNLKNVSHVIGKTSHRGYEGQRFKPHVFSGAQLGLYLLANAMLMMSSRDQMTKGGFDEKSMGQLEDAAARLVMAQPPQAQQALLKEVSEFMAKEKGVNLDAPTIANDLAKRIGEITRDRLQPGASWAEKEQEKAATLKEAVR
jgi:hypothetical protein